MTALAPRRRAESSTLKRLWYRLNILLWPLGGIWKKVGRLPVLGRVVGPLLWNEKNVDATYVPVGEPVAVDPGSPLPYRVIEGLLEQACALHVVNECACRAGNRCREYPRGTGCLFLGEAGGDIDPGLARPVSVEEAREHIRGARGHGLLPCIVHGSFDSSLFRIDYRRMLAICFCCNCCCAFRADMRGGPLAYLDRITKLPGIEVAGLGRCRGCGACVEACPFGAVRLGESGPEFGDLCKACGRCADACPAGNIAVILDPSTDTLGELLERIRSRTDIT